METFIRNSLYDPVTNPLILDAMKAVPRHRFVPAQNQPYAYENTPLPIGQGQIISQPIIVDHMTELLKIKPGSKILETVKKSKISTVSEFPAHCSLFLDS